MNDQTIGEKFDAGWEIAASGTTDVGEIDKAIDLFLQHPHFSRRLEEKIQRSASNGVIHLQATELNAKIQPTMQRLYERHGLEVRWMKDH